jgi:hypothetical protein
MKTKLTRFVLGSALAMSGSVLFAQIADTNLNTNAVPLNQTLKYQVVREQDRNLGEHALLPPGLKEKLRLTDAQQLELAPIEEDFAKTSREYQVANQPRIDAAQEANRQARESKNTEQIQDARKQLQNVWAGLQKYRDESVRKAKHLLTPEQITILEDPNNQWRENHASEANDPSAN